MHEILDEFEFLPDLTTHKGVALERLEKSPYFTFGPFGPLRSLNIF